MAVHVQITEASGLREQTIPGAGFWIGAQASGCEVELLLPNCAGRVLEVQVQEEGRLRIRVENGLPFPVRCVTGNVGRRFEALLDGDVLNVGPVMVRLRHLAEPDATVHGRALEPADLAISEGVGAPVGAWYQTFMAFADNLEGVASAERMLDSAMEAILNCTGADRVFIELQRTADDAPSAFFRSHAGDRTPFVVSRSLVEQALSSKRVIHVPLAADDPVASTYVSIRREGISSSIAIPIEALGQGLGVLYADCVRDGAVLTPADLQRVAFIGRMLAGALGNRDLVATLAQADSGGEGAIHPALQTSSPACVELVQRVKTYAPTDYTVLIRGETGTGKEVIARALHDLSRRREGPFVPVNCAAIPETLMESVLFGHEKGAFTGATETSPGHFEQAHDGTILLDEIGDMALDLQAKILRVLQDRIVMPVGSRRQIKVDVRILAATHRDLESMVRDGQFREDLYFRLRELEIVLPALRERREDLQMLAGRFLHEAATELGRTKPPELAADAIEFMEHQAWRGNIRELRHVLKGAALRAGDGPIRAEHLDAGTLGALAPLAGAADGDAAEPEATALAVSDASTWKERLERQERAALQATLSEARGNLTRGAELFGVPRTTYREKLVKHGLLDVGGS